MVSSLDIFRQNYHLTQVGPAWYGPALEALLGDLSAEEAAQKPLRGQHSIWELVLHLRAWRSFVAERLQAHHGFDIPLDSVADWPAVPHPSAAAWTDAQAGLRREGARLQALLADATTDLLVEDVFGKSYPYHTMLMGLAQHDAYHAGQIALLKRTLRTSSSASL